MWINSCKLIYLVDINVSSISFEVAMLKYPFLIQNGITMCLFIMNLRPMKLIGQIYVYVFNGIILVK